jgi:hypothetical protein
MLTVELFSLFELFSPLFELECLLSIRQNKSNKNEDGINSVRSKPRNVNMITGFLRFAITNINMQ